MKQADTAGSGRLWARAILAFVILAGLLLALSYTRTPRVPTHAGRTVYDWMFQTRSSALEDNKGLSAIGSNAVPYLARALEMRNTPYDRFTLVRHPRVQASFTNLGLGIKWTIPSVEIRRAASMSLLAFGFEAFPALPQLHAEVIRPDAQDRQTIINCLSRLGPLPESVPYLAQAWPLAVRESANVRNDLLHALGRAGTNAASAAMPWVVEALSDSSSGVRNMAANALERWALPAPAAVPKLISLLSSTNAHLAGAAAAALGQVTNRADEAMPALRTLLASTNGYTRVMAAATIWRLGGDAEEMRLFLENLLTNKTSRGPAAAVLGKMGAAARTSVPALLHCSHQDIGGWVDMYDRARCAKAVLQIQGESAEAIGVLAQAITNEPNGWIRATVAGEMASLGPTARPLIPALQRALFDSDRDVRRAAANALKDLEKLNH